ncbi:MAG: serine/threonine protein kinase [Myxococcota bacterium]
MSDQTGQLVADRYRIERTLGVGAQGRTFLARDARSGQEVALKRLTMADVPDWKAVELFEREGDALRSLDHRRIPDYLDAFSVEDDETLRFYLAQSYVEGDNLQDLIDAGERWDEVALVDFLDQMLRILSYLGARRPPVVHRDLKPRNIIRDPDGQYHLVDFGAVQTALASSSGSSTVIGTGGFVPVEQLMGRATPRSDLYALGATALYLASGEHPSTIETSGLKLKFRRHVALEPRLAAFIDGLLEPQPEDRYPTAREALAALETRNELAGATPNFPLELAGGLILVDYAEGRFSVDVQDDPFTRTGSKAGIVMILVGLMASLGALIQPIYAYIGLPFAGLGLLLLLLMFTKSRQRKVDIEDGQIKVERRALGLPTGGDSLEIDDLVGVVTEGESVYLVDGTQSVELPNLRGQSEDVARQIRAHVGLEREQVSS